MRTLNGEWRDVKHPRTLPLGIRVRGYRNPSGREYMKRFGGQPFDHARPSYWPKAERKSWDGVLIRNEWVQNVVINVRYTVRCDDGKIRKFQVIERI